MGPSVRTLSRRAIGEYRLSATAGQQEPPHSQQLLWILLVGPQKNANWARPEDGERLRCLKDMGGVGKLLAKPEIAAGLVQDTQWNMSVEIYGRSLMIFAVHHDEVPGPIFLLDRNRQIVRGQDGGESRE